MSIGSHGERQAVIRSALLRTAGAGADANAMAAAAVALWQRVSSQLVPVVGVGGVDALCTRCLHLRRVDRPKGNGVTPSLASPAAPFHAVSLHLQRREAADALHAGVALLETLITLLSSLIGEPLTARLLNPVWADGPTDEPAQEKIP